MSFLFNPDAAVASIERNALLRYKDDIILEGRREITLPNGQKRDLSFIHKSAEYFYKPNFINYRNWLVIAISVSFIAIPAIFLLAAALPKYIAGTILVGVYAQLARSYYRLNYAPFIYKNESFPPLHQLVENEVVYDAQYERNNGVYSLDESKRALMKVYIDKCKQNPQFGQIIFDKHMGKRTPEIEAYEEGLNAILNPHN